VLSVTNKTIMLSVIMLTVVAPKLEHVLKMIQLISIHFYFLLYNSKIILSNFKNFVN